MGRQAEGCLRKIILFPCDSSICTGPMQPAANASHLVVIQCLKTKWWRYVAVLKHRFELQGSENKWHNCSLFMASVSDGKCTSHRMAKAGNKL